MCKSSARSSSSHTRHSRDLRLFSLSFHASFDSRVMSTGCVVLIVLPALEAKCARNVLCKLPFVLGGGLGILFDIVSSKVGCSESHFG